MGLRPLALLPLLLAACTTYDPETAPRRSSTGRPFAERVADLPVENAARLAPGVYRGAWPGADGLQALRDRGFRTVVNLRSAHSHREEAKALGLAVVEIPLVAGLGCTPPDAAEVRRFLEVVTDPANQPVYFHCLHGKDRTGTLAAVYRMEVEGWSAAEAAEELRAFGYHEWYRDFAAFVEGYRPSGRYALSRARP